MSRTADTSRVVPRDTRIDVARGLVLLVIFINHMPGNLLSKYTPYHFGFSDSAEVFVLLAGISAALAYGKLLDTQGWLVGVLSLMSRIWTLYVAHLLLFLIVCGVVFFAVVHTQNPLYVELINIQPFLSDPVNALLDVLRLAYQPTFLNILPLYMVLLALFPLLYGLARWHPLLALAASLGLWQSVHSFNLNLPEFSGNGWYFNPLAWQLLFTLGLLAGLRLRRGQAAPRAPGLTLLAATVVLVLGLVKLYPSEWAAWPMLESWVDHLHLTNDKTNQSLIRVIHVLAVAWLFHALIPAHAAVLKSGLCRGLALMGRHSLAVFSIGTVLAIVGQILMAETAFALEVQLAICLAGALALFGVGAFLSWYQAQPGLGLPRRALPKDAVWPARS